MSKARPEEPRPLPPGSRDLDTKLAAALERVAQALRVQLWDEAKRHGLTPTQLQLLLRLAHQPAATHAVGGLAVEFDLSQPTVSDAIAVLERKGLVRRERVAADRRRQMLALTEDGGRLAARVAGWDARTRAALEVLPEERRQEALGFLIELIARMQEAGVISVGRMCTTCRFFRPARSDERHYCALLELPLGPADLRVDCPEHQRAA